MTRVVPFNEEYKRLLLCPCKYIGYVNVITQDLEELLVEHICTA